MRLAVVSAILFLSGTSALLFETLWLRLSGLAFGNSIWSASLILSSFMAGLALGSAIAASCSLRDLRPLRIYAGLEIIVAICGCTLVFSLPSLGEWLRPLFQALWSYQQLLNALRFSISFLILLLPTTAMGLTLPVLLEDPVLERFQFSRTIGALYGFNTLGAVAGSLIGEMFLVRMFGLFGTALSAVGISLLAAAIAIWMSFSRSSVPNETAKAREFRLSLGQETPWHLFFVSGGSGAILLALEIVWFRFLRLYVASTSIAFCVMLAVVLLGIGLGSTVFSLFAKRSGSLRMLLPLLLLLAAIGTLLSYVFFPIPPTYTDANGFYIEDLPQIVGLSFAFMFPASFLSGILFSATASSIQSRILNRMNSAGLTILCNTIGATIGPVIAAFVLLPRVGFQTSLIICAAGYAILAIVVLDRKAWSFRNVAEQLVLSLGVGFVAIIALFPFHRAQVHFANARRAYEADGSRLIKRIEGNADTFQLLRRDLFGEPYYYRLVTNDYSMSGTLPLSQRYMRLFAYLPLALRPESEDALLICYGVGVTADALTRDARLKHLDVVDISKEIFDLAKSYSSPGYSDPLTDPRVKTFVQDGRFFLQATGNKYDIITGEPPPLKVMGTVNLYTEEFFRLTRSRLKDGGIVTFWLPIYQLEPEETKTILRTFHNVFSNTTVWSSGDLEWIMMGIKDPLPKADDQPAENLWQDPQIAADLKRIGVEVPSQMSALFLMDGDEIDRITHGVAPLTDLFPQRLSDRHANLEAAYNFGFNFIESGGAMHRFISSPLIEKIWPNEWKKSLDRYFFVREIQFRTHATPSNRLARLDFFLRRTELRVPVLNARNSDEFRLALAQRFAQKSPTLPNDVLPDLVSGALAERNYPRAIQLLETEMDREIADQANVFLLVYLYCVNGNVEKAEAFAAAKASSYEKDEFVIWFWGKLQAEFGFRPPR